MNNALLIFFFLFSFIPAANWINWIPQLITLLIRNDDTGKYITNLMYQIVRKYPLFKSITKLTFFDKFRQI